MSECSCDEWNKVAAISFDFWVDEYHINAAQFWCAICHYCRIIASSIQEVFASMSLFLVAVDTYSWPFSKFFGTDNVNRF